MTRVLAVADSDSYLKWAAGLLDQLPSGWSSTLTVVRTPILPSPAQVAAAVSGTRAGAHEPPVVVSARALRRIAERTRPDAVLVACTGPVVDVLVSEVLAGLVPRPVFVSGLPGISIPATEKAWLFRGACDLFVVHSGKEVEEFGRIGKELGAAGSVGLARLPYLDHGAARPAAPAPLPPAAPTGPGPAPGVTAAAASGAVVPTVPAGQAPAPGATAAGAAAVPGVVVPAAVVPGRAAGDVVPGAVVPAEGMAPLASPAADRVIFATQAKVPRRREERESILLALAALADARPDLDVVVKLRALESERQTHNERHHYERLWRSLVETGAVRPGAVRFAAGPMHEHLARASAFVTVSSTAALEAIAGRVPLLVLSDFGVSAEMINLVFEDSGCLGTLDDLARGEFRQPTAAWCDANYFHDPALSDWTGRLAALVERSHTGGLPPARPLLDGPAHVAARRRARMRVEVPPNVLRAGYRARRRVRRYLKALG
ncbi:DUF6716 putative glycosyltransferase [Sphaerisporangium sp. TRM90804]|uniref:DUF6716 putative glycosyltransferase n=1 Tax=Sphaerisporangium sp. TRM90804 TaxID=3031113 RepID=UPI00244BA511|nr:DUF6716 putative glycosyltransferase [Sphaerisporangium sp. TRM90804]MDH2429556.1 hypothetical protein [Sphaerisporangium sp. TRM90804]